MKKKILTGIVVILFVICGIYIGHLLITIADVRETQRQRGIEFEARRRTFTCAVLEADTRSEQIAWRQ